MVKPNGDETFCSSTLFVDNPCLLSRAKCDIPNCAGQDWPLWEESSVLGGTLHQNIQQATRLNLYIPCNPKASLWRKQNEWVDWSMFIIVGSNFSTPTIYMRVAFISSHWGRRAHCRWTGRSVGTSSLQTWRIMVQSALRKQGFSSSCRTKPFPLRRMWNPKIPPRDSRRNQDPML